MERHARRPFGLFIAVSLLLIPLFAGVVPASAWGPKEPASAILPPVASVTPAASGSRLLRFPISGEPTTLDPAQYAWGVDESIQWQVFEGLTRYDEDLNVIPAVASAWSSTDARVWTFTLRRDVYFHNGRQVKANDFVYSWGRAKAADGYYVSLYDDIAAFAAPDDFTFVVTLAAPSATFPIKIALPIFAVIPFEAAGAIDTHPVGTGAFEFVNWNSGDKIVLRRFAGYYDRPAYLPGVEYKFIADTDVQWAEFQAGNLDVTLIPADRWSAIRTDPNVLASPTMLTWAYGFDMVAHPDVRVRKAFQKAIDRAAIASDPAVAPYDPAPLAYGVVSPGKGSYDNSDLATPYDPAAALDLLATAGWRDTNGDGILDDGAGHNLDVVVQDAKSSAGHAMALRIAHDLADIGGAGVGVSVTMTTTQSAATLLRVGWGSDYPDPGNDLLPYKTDGLFAPRLHYSSAAFENVLTTAQATLDEGARNAAFHAAEALLVLNDAAVAPIYYTSTQLLKSSEVHDLRLTELGNQAIMLKRVWVGPGLPLKAYLPVLRTLPSAPAVPALNSIVPPEANPSYTVGWTASAGAESYVLERATGASFGDAIQVYAGPATSYRAASAGIATYYYRVKARNAAGDKGWSNVQTVMVRWETEPNEGYSDASGPLASGLSYYGRPESFNDYYYFDSRATGEIRASVTGHASPQGVQMQLWYQSTAKPENKKAECQGVGSCSLPAYSGPTGRYYIRVFTASPSDSLAPYTLRAVLP